MHSISVTWLNLSLICNEVEERVSLTVVDQAKSIPVGFFLPGWELLLHYLKRVPLLDQLSFPGYGGLSFGRGWEESEVGP